MLDDLKFIHQHDREDALGIAEKQWQQLQHNFEVTWRPASHNFDLRSIAVAGMGGSALAATVIQSWPKTIVPFQIVRDYELPASINANTLFIASSYSGDTEETLAALEEAERRGCEIAVITSGGTLGDQASQKGYPIFQLPSGLQPRHAAFYNLAALIQLLALAGQEGGAENIEELHQVAGWLKDKIPAWIPTVATAHNLAKQIAQECIGKSVVMYAGPKLYPAAYKWKISFNENAKHIAWVNQYPEFNHNEMLGWTKQPVQKPYTVIELRSKLEHPRIQKRFEVSERLLNGLRPAPIVVEPEGQTILDQLVWTIALGDFVSIYTALLNGLDPTPVDLIEKFKKTLG